MRVSGPSFGTRRKRRDVGPSRLIEPVDFPGFGSGPKCFGGNELQGQSPDPSDEASVVRVDGDVRVESFARAFVARAADRMDPHFARSRLQAVEAFNVDRQVTTPRRVRRGVKVRTRLDERGIGMETGVEQRRMKEGRPFAELIGHDDACENLAFAAKERFDPAKRGTVFQPQSSQRPVVAIRRDGFCAALPRLAKIKGERRLVARGRGNLSAPGR